MKKHLFLLLFSFLSAISFGQNNPFRINNLSVGYYGHYLFHPGMKIGTQYNVKTWQKEKEKKKYTKTIEKNVFLSPQIGFYTHPKNHSGLLVNLEFGYQTLKTKRGFYQAYSIGLGSLTHYNSGTTYQYEKGVITEQNLGSRTYINPTLNAEFGQRVNTKIGWFTKLSIGSKLFYNSSISFDTYFETGIKLNLTR